MTIALDRIASGLLDGADLRAASRRESSFIKNHDQRQSPRSPVRLSDLSRGSSGEVLRSSAVFQPDLYFKTRGLSVSFGGGDDRMSPDNGRGQGAPVKDGEVWTVRTKVRGSLTQPVSLALQSFD
jgi:hypothetical protein